MSPDATQGETVRGVGILDSTNLIITYIPQYNRWVFVWHWVSNPETPPILSLTFYPWSYHGLKLSVFFMEVFCCTSSTRTVTQTCTSLNTIDPYKYKFLASRSLFVALYTCLNDMSKFYLSSRINPPPLQGKKFETILLNWNFHQLKKTNTTKRLNFQSPNSLINRYSNRKHYCVRKAKKPFWFNFQRILLMLIMTINFRVSLLRD